MLMFSHWILSNDKLQDLYLVLSDSCPLILISNCQNILSICLSALLYHRISSYLSCLTVTHITSVLSLSIQSISHSISFVSFHSICRQYQSWALGPDGQAWSFGLRRRMIMCGSAPLKARACKYNHMEAQEVSDMCGSGYLFFKRK